MADKQLFSIGKAISEVVVRGDLTGPERETHFSLERAADAGKYKWLKGGNPRDVRLFVAIELFTRQITTAGFPIGLETFGASNLLVWSACLRAGATLLTGLSRNATLWSIGQLPVPVWVSEIGMDVSSDPVFAGYAVSPKRISGLLTVSRQLLIQGGPELDRILISDISRQLSAYLDESALYGGGPAANQPTGLINVAGVNQGVAIDPANLHPSFCVVEKLIEDADVSMDNYGVLCSTDSKRILNSTAAFAGGSDSVWEKLTNPISSPEITDNRCFAGAWNNLTFCLWGRAVEILVDHLTLALTGQVKIYATLLADVGCGIRPHSKSPRRLRDRYAPI